MIIRKANKSDLDNIMLMYKSCVKGMLANDIDQWDETYPNTGVIIEDLIAQSYFVAIENEIIIGGINIDQNQDPTYLPIDWKDKTNQFLVVHRLGVMQEFWNKKIGIIVLKKLSNEKYTINKCCISFFLYFSTERISVRGRNYRNPKHRLCYGFGSGSRCGISSDEL